MRSFPGMSAKGEGLSHVMAEIPEDKVKVVSNDTTGLYVKFDKTPTHVSPVFL